MRKIDTKSATKASKATSKKAGKAASKATVKDIGGGCKAVTLTGELAEMTQKVARISGVTHDAAIRTAIKFGDEKSKRALEVCDIINQVAACPGVSVEVFSNIARALQLMCSVTSVKVPEGKKAVFIPETAYRHLEQMADAMNQDKWAGQDNTAQGVFSNLVFDSDLEDDPANLMDGVLAGLDYLPEVEHDKRTPQDEKTIKHRKATLTRRAAMIKWA